MDLNKYKVQGDIYLTTCSAAILDPGELSQALLYTEIKINEIFGFTSQSGAKIGIRAHFKDLEIIT